ncbi:hypothetical protein MP228_002504 [Amoeboaphelidium protococcarum]|nr:hypothetical protein MP228_002504 [Amoeboaphelidium protococcarum]
MTTLKVKESWKFIGDSHKSQGLRVTVTVQIDQMLCDDAKVLYKHQLESLYEVKELSYELASDDDMTAADLYDWELVGDTFTGGSSLQLSAPVTRADKRLLVVAYQMLSAHPQRLHPRPLDSAWSLQALSSDQLVGVSLRGKGRLQDRAYGAGCAQCPSGHEILGQAQMRTKGYKYFRTCGRIWALIIHSLHVFQSAKERDAQSSISVKQ